MIKAALLGLGTIGKGVYELIMTKNICEEIQIAKILVKDKTKERPGINKALLVYDVKEVLEDKEIEIIIDITGDYNHSYDTIKKALEAKKHVITANKEVVAFNLRELSQLAKDNQVAFLFEASVGGGIPIISSLKEAIKVNKVDSIKGILNGTTNFILSKMQHERYELKEAIDEAIERGFAEPDPTTDISGFDVVRKICVLSMIAYKGMIDLNKIYRFGIETMNNEDVLFIKANGYGVKLLATSTFDETVDIRVEPTLLDFNDHLVSIKNENNVISFYGDVCGNLEFQGVGAGAYCTSNSVLADLYRILEKKYEYYDVDKDYEIMSKNEKSLYYIRQNGKRTFKKLTRKEFLELEGVEFYAKTLGGIENETV